TVRRKAMVGAASPAAARYAAVVAASSTMPPHAPHAKMPFGLASHAPASQAASSHGSTKSPNQGRAHEAVSMARLIIPSATPAPALARSGISRPAGVAAP